jgi:hypothetical protein
MRGGVLEVASTSSGGVESNRRGVISAQAPVQLCHVREAR